MCLFLFFCRDYTQINTRELDYSYDDCDEGTSLQIDKYRIQGQVEDVSDLVSNLGMRYQI